MMAKAWVHIFRLRNVWDCPASAKENKRPRRPPSWQKVAAVVVVGLPYLAAAPMWRASSCRLMCRGLVLVRCCTAKGMYSEVSAMTGRSTLINDLLDNPHTQVGVSGSVDVEHHADGGPDASNSGGDGSSCGTVAETNQRASRPSNEVALTGVAGGMALSDNDALTVSASASSCRPFANGSAVPAGRVWMLSEQKDKALVLADVYRTEPEPTTTPHFKQLDNRAVCGGFRYYDKGDPLEPHHRLAGTVEQTTDGNGPRASNSVAVSGSKRARVEHSPSRAAASGSLSGGPQQAAQGHDQQHQQQQQVVHRPCLCGLPGHLLCEMASHLTTIEATALLCLNSDIRSKANYDPDNTPTTQDNTDGTSVGIFRHLTIAPHETDTWKRLKKATRTRLLGKLGHVTEARIAAAGPYPLPFVSTSLEASKATLTQVYITVADERRRYKPRPRNRPPPPVAFDNVTTLHVTSGVWIQHFSDCNWRFQSLVNLRVGHLTSCRYGDLPHLPHLTRIVQTSPKLKTLTTERIKGHGVGDGWRAFTDALRECRHLTTIRGVEVYDSADLQQALETIWGREDMQGVQKTIQLLFTSPTISHTFDDHTRPLHKFLTWARKLGVSVEWRPLAELPLVEDDDDEPSMRVDCREEVSSASPAVVQQLAQQATKVDLYCGGTPLHESRKSLLTFPNAKTLYIDAPDDTPVQKGLDGIPPFVLETDKEDGNNK
ncbi:unnamed protein product [Vitrella brassicaformis CCMP3155]|uniref:Uncharacterized protein n=1 Tax=Vitrella brassicaformis (strain CCMP3155) TaxID=1169540 RepID=A0A0G4FIB0_VITBC|nr:unnamed protein product [Vitrella brassicaformis CCMP3155]|eukprot:CEM13214.1 unnamed protein product [Vitrella brassicaformis CCMP3155]